MWTETNMEKVRQSILQVNVLCTELDDQDHRPVGEEEYTGTCFCVNADFLKHLPFYDENKKFFITNFHVVDDADDRMGFLRTAPMGKSMFDMFVEAVVPKLDIAILSVDIGKKHERWFRTKSSDAFLDDVEEITLHTGRISNRSQKVTTIGFPQGLEEHESQGFLAGRGADDEEMLQLNMSINSGNSGGPLVDVEGRVIGVCTSTLMASEAIAFAVPAYSIVQYFKKYYTSPYGLFPAWGIETVPMTQAYAKRYGISGVGCVVHDIHPLSVANGKFKKGDVIHSVGGVDLDRFGMLVDPTRGSKISFDNTEFILGIEDYTMSVSTKSQKRTVNIVPAPILYKVTDNYKEWNPVKMHQFGPFTFMSLSKTHLESSVPAEKAVLLLAAARSTKCAQEITYITKIKDSAVSSYEVPEEYDQVLKIGRKNIKSMKDLVSACNTARQMHANGEKDIEIETTSGSMVFFLNNILTKKFTKKRKRL